MMRGEMERVKNESIPYNHYDEDLFKRIFLSLLLSRSFYVIYIPETLVSKKKNQKLKKL